MAEVPVGADRHRWDGTSEFAERMVISTRQPEAVIR
jgi:hypothetical protein